MRSRRRRKMAWSADVSPATGGLNLDFQRSTEFGGEEESEVWVQVVSLPLSRRAASSGEFETKSTFQSAGESDLVVLAEVGDHGEGVVADLLEELEEVTNRTSSWGSWMRWTSPIRHPLPGPPSGRGYCAG